MNLEDISTPPKHPYQATKIDRGLRDIINSRKIGNNATTVNLGWNETIASRSKNVIKTFQLQESILNKLLQSDEDSEISSTVEKHLIMLQQSF